MDTRERKSKHPCSWCVTVAKWIPVVFIVAIIVWSYYAYVIQLCLFTVNSIVEKIFYLLVYHVAFAMFVWSYWQTIFVTTPDVPKQFWLRKIEKDNSKKELGEEHRQRYFEAFVKEFNLPVSCRTESGVPIHRPTTDNAQLLRRTFCCDSAYCRAYWSRLNAKGGYTGIRHCAKCQLIKPDRAHHCSACDRCVLKMDHHCPWVNNCVCFQNYKFFVLFLGYSLLYCLFIAGTSLQYFIKFWRNELTDSGRFHILFLFFMAIMFAISLASLFCYHCYLTSVNRTTLESFRAPVFRTGPDKDGFSLGRYNNFVEVFGSDRKKWCLPIFTAMGNGIEFPTRIPQPHSYNSMGITQPSVGEGVTFPQRIIDEDTDELLSRQRWLEDADDSLNQAERGVIGVQQSSRLVGVPEVNISNRNGNSPV